MSLFDISEKIKQKEINRKKIKSFQNKHDQKIEDVHRIRSSVWAFGSWTKKKIHDPRLVFPHGMPMNAIISLYTGGCLLIIPEFVGPISPRVNDDECPIWSLLVVLPG